MGLRKIPLVENEIYHIYTRSIAEYVIFKSESDYQRMRDVLGYYLSEKPLCKFSEYQELKKTISKDAERRKIVKILAYCIMPTHIHVVLKQLVKDGISKYMNLILKSYGRYFNVKYNRLGPLYEGRFKNVLVDKDEQLLHLTRYIHLNPVSLSLVNDPDLWKYSSYKEYLGEVPEEKCICDFSDVININTMNYKEFVTERAAYQKELEKIKHVLLD